MWIIHRQRLWPGFFFSVVLSSLWGSSATNRMWSLESALTQCRYVSVFLCERGRSQSVHMQEKRRKGFIQTMTEKFIFIGRQISSVTNRKHVNVLLMFSWGHKCLSLPAVLSRRSNNMQLSAFSANVALATSASLHRMEKPCTCSQADDVFWGALSSHGPRLYQHWFMSPFNNDLWSKSKLGWGFLTIQSVI